MSLSPFDFINAISLSKKDLMADDNLAHKDYVPFIVNRGLSYFPDTILYANEMNLKAGIPNDWQFSFYLNSIPKKKRFSKWHKKDVASESFRLVKEYYGYSDEKCKDALTILTEHHLTMIKEKLFKGGK
jgi:hypothetical protein